MTIDEFVCRYFSLQQTALVDNMLYEDKHMDMFNSLYNLHMHTVELSTGSFTGTHQQLMTKKATINKTLQRGKNKALQLDIELLETTQGTQRTVYEWYTIPYWIARHMIDSDEVALSWRDSYWWGRCTTGSSLVHENAVLTLFAQYNASQ
jgi:hypothetical protein